MVVHGPYPIGEPRVAREARVALECGYEVDVVCLRRPGEQRFEVVEGIRVFRLPLRHARGAGFLRVAGEYLGFAVLSTLRVARLGVRSQYAVVQVHSPPDFLVVAAFIPKLRGARLILDIHDPSPELFAMRFAGRPGARAAQRLLTALEAWSTRLVDVVITVHEPYRGQLAGRGVPREKIVVVMNSVDERLLPARRPRRRGERFEIVYHGTVTPPYGVELVVEAAARLRDELGDFRVQILGEGDALPNVRSRAKALGIADHVEMSGRYLPHVEALERVAGASVGVIPNLPTELNAFMVPTKLLEYVALGVPVVAARLRTLAEHFFDDEILFFEPGDVAGLAEGLLTVARDPAAAAIRADAARQRYEAYRWPTNASRYAAVLSDESASGS
jgi:glycosyltransferase involved in cell wall biosynthesis